MNKNLSDVLITTAKGAVSILPGGGLLAEYIGLAQSSIVDKRMNEWKQNVEQILEKIPRSISELAGNEDFYCCVQEATIGVMRTYQEEKRILFANALYNSAINTDLDTDKKLFFLRLLSEYTLSHIKLLKYFSKDNFGPEDKGQKIGMGTIENIGGTEKPMDGIIEAIPELKGDPMFVKHVAGQLISDSMISVIDFEMPVRKELARGKRITPYGKQFLDFIKIVKADYHWEVKHDQRGNFGR